jgi:hypothetical protein
MRLMHGARECGVTAVVAWRAARNARESDDRHHRGYLGAKPIDRTGAGDLEFATATFTALRACDEATGIVA